MSRTTPHGYHAADKSWISLPVCTKDCEVKHTIEDTASEMMKAAEKADQAVTEAIKKAVESDDLAEEEGRTAEKLAMAIVACLDAAAAYEGIASRYAASAARWHEASSEARKAAEAFASAARRTILNKGKKPT